ncbi:ArnT family glycosyltransferase [Desulfonatronum thioautotrophicum]|uniref:ArnT family glycosyltransferase n=1 Tax=Desulfonatronum thioautotrophicum TaxID=617001 RepID=UPI0005EBE049|nr:glycosyltransferase family 39 protein [Desulfonatronum thioautotrophicum]
MTTHADNVLSGATGYLLLTCLCLVLFLPGITTLPPFDRDEARFAQASRQMVEDGDLINIKFQDTDRHKKPVGIYWLQAATARLTNPDALWPYRLPSVLGALLAVLLTFSLAKRTMEIRFALASAALLACTILLVTEARLAKTDAMLLASITAMQAALARCYTRPKDQQPESWLWLLFWLGMGGSILLKGPVGPMISGLTLLTLFIADRRDQDRLTWLRGLRPKAGLILTAAMVLPWLIAVSLATDGSFVSDAVTGDLLPKLISGHESHGAPPGLYLLLFTLTFWPGSLLAWPALIQTWPQRKTDRLVRFLWAWIVPSWIVFELVPTKLPHYVLPLYPAIALLIGIWLSRLARSAPPPHAPLTSEIPPGRFASLVPKIGAGLWLGIGGLLGLGLIIAPLYLDKTISWWGILAALVALAMTILGWRAYQEGRMIRVCGIVLLGAVLVFPIIFGKGLPELRGFWVSRTIVQMMDSLRQEHPNLDGMVASVGFHEPSLVFLLGRSTLLTNHLEAAAHLKSHSGGLALVESRYSDRFHLALEELALDVERLAIIRGFNYSKGQWVTIGFYRAVEK